MCFFTWSSAAAGLVTASAEHRRRLRLSTMLQSTMIWKESSQVFSRQLQLPSTQYRSSWKRHANHFILCALLFHCVCSYALLLFYFIAQLTEFIYFVQMYTFWYVTQTKAWKRQRGRREGRKKTSTVFKDCDSSEKTSSLIK